MTDEDAPDPVAIQKHAKKLYSAVEYARRFRRLDFYRPNAKQKAFHNINATERLLQAGNQIGKSTAAAAEIAMHALGRYPSWWQGRRFTPDNRPNIERPHTFLAWISGPTSTTVRDTGQTKLLGNVMDRDGLGTGFLPLESIMGKPTMARGISGFVDNVTIRRDDGTLAVIATRTYEQSRDAWQGATVDCLWFDEDPGLAGFELYSEGLARITTTRGIILVTMTPLLGRTPLIKRFDERDEQRQVVKMNYLEADHLDAEQKATLESRYAPHERQTRLFGVPMQGEGAVFMTPENDIKHTLSPADVPAHWPWIWGLDFSHGGMSAQAHPAGIVLAAWDRDHDVLFVMDAYRQRGSIAEQCARIKHSPVFDAPVAYGHDASQGVAGSAATIGSLYRKEGLRMLPKHATFPDGGFDFEAGILAMSERFASGRLKVAAHLADFFDEYRGYHRENGKVVKVDDDILSALRMVVMQHRSARVLEQIPGGASVGYARNQSYSKDARGRELRALGAEESYFGIDN